MWRGPLNGDIGFEGSQCMAVRTRNNTVKHPWPYSSLPGIFGFFNHYAELSATKSSVQNSIVSLFGNFSL